MIFPPMRALEYKTGHVIYNPAYAYKFQLKTTLICIYADIVGGSEKVQNYADVIYKFLTSFATSAIV